MSERVRKMYEVEGRKFYQEELVWGQVKWMQELTGSMSNLADTLALFGPKLARFLAIVLVEEGKTQFEKVEAGEAGLEALEKFFLGSLRPSQAKVMVADFFDLTKLGELLEVVLTKLGAPPSVVDQSAQTVAGLPTV